MNIKISKGNTKMGSISSVSLPAGLTCRTDCECSKKCYAKRLERMRPSVMSAYQHNYNILLNEPNIYWREVEASIMMSRFFRFHVSGDIVDNSYLKHMIEIAERNPHCEMLCFTKKYCLVNEFLNIGGHIPDNLHIIFSGWRGLEMDNPYCLPEAHVMYKDGSTTAQNNALVCKGNCTDCALTNEGCWTLKLGEQVVFYEH